MQMNVIPTDDSFQNLHIQCIAGLPDEFSTTHLNIAPQYFVPIFGTPYDMNMQLVNAMATFS